MRQRILVILSLFLFCGLLSCGNTGDLYLPETATTEQDGES